MTEQLPAQAETKSDFTGKHVDIRLLDETQLIEMLTNHEQGQNFLKIQDKDNLPYPAREVVLESWYTVDPNSPHISAEIAFEPTALEFAPQTWPSDFFSELIETVESYGYEVSTQTHDSNAVYISLDPSYSIRIALATTATECTIDIDLEPSRQIVDATKEDFLEPYSRQNLAPLERFSHVVSALGMSIDLLREYYGNPPKHHKRYTLIQKQPIKTLVHLPNSTPNGEPHHSEYADMEQSFEDGLESVGGATHAKQRLRENASVMDDPAIAAEFDVQRSNFVLYGPPGTGKSSLVQALCNEIGATLVQISSTDLVNKYVGDSGKAVVEAFNDVKKIPGKVVMSFEEFDSLGLKQGNGAGERTDIRKILNIQIEDITKNHPNIIIAATTNADIDDLEPSLIRPGRLEPIGVPVPNEEERFDIFGTILLKSIVKHTSDEELVFNEEGKHVNFTLYDESIDVRALAQLTDGFTGADFEEILERARKKKFVHFRNTGEKLPISQQDVLHEISQFGR